MQNQKRKDSSSNVYFDLGDSPRCFDEIGKDGKGDELRCDVDKRKHENVHVELVKHEGRPVEQEEEDEHHQAQLQEVSSH